jgi:acyl transferase domain-containing protein
MMEPIREEFVRQIKEIKFNKPRIPYISNVSANWLTGEQAVDPGYWGKHMCSRVRFSEGIKELLKEDGAVFIEIGPGRVLSNIVRHHAPPGKKNPPGVVNVIKHQQEKAADDYFLLKKIGELWLYGVKIDWNGFYAGEKRSRVTLPTYPFEKKRYWLDEDPGQQAVISPFSFGQARSAEAVEKADKSENNQEYEQEPLTEMPGFPGHEEEYAAPRDELEQNIARVWQEFLGFKRIGIHTNFFDINGDSLTAAQLVTRLQHIYQVEISLQQFFENPTILHLAEMIQTLLIEKVKNLSEEELDRLAGTA